MLYFIFIIYLSELSEMASLYIESNIKSSYFEYDINSRPMANLDGEMRVMNGLVTEQTLGCRLPEKTPFVYLHSDHHP